MAGSSDVSACRKRNSTSIELTGQVTYDIDIASIPIGSAARASFENEFTIAVSIAMAVQSKDVVINNIAAVRAVSSVDLACTKYKLTCSVGARDL